MSITQHELHEAVVGNRLALSKLYAVVPTTAEKTAATALAPQQAAGGRLVTTTEQTLVGSLAPGGWADLQAKRMLELVTDLNCFWATPTQFLGTSAAWGVSYVAGGGKAIVADTWALFSGPLVVNPHTSHWALAARIRHLGAAIDAKFGLYNGDDTALVTMRGTQTPKVFGLEYRRAGGDAVVVDSESVMTTNAHDILIASDGTTLSMAVDGVVLLEASDSAHMPNTPCSMAALCAGSSVTLIVTDVAYGVKR